MGLGCFLVLALSFCAQAQAASLYTESFSGSSGWSSSGGAAVAETLGELRVSFPDIFPLPPESVLLLATNGASGGAFTGDYAAAGVELIGFRFKADDAVPDSLLIELRAGAQSYSSPQLRGQVVQTGVWCDVWTVLGGDEWAGNSSVVTGVTQLAVYIKQAASGAETCHVDDVFTDSMPIAGRVAAGAAETTIVSWSHLRSGWFYSVSTCVELPAGNWSNVSAFTTVGVQQDVVVTNEAAGRLFIRVGK